MRARSGVDRRSGLDRRETYDLEHFLLGGRERRNYAERRHAPERRIDWVQITSWSSTTLASGRTALK